MSDEILRVEAEDPEMARAILAAQVSFPEFARQAELEHFRVVPAFEMVAIKAFFPDPARPGSGEHMFVPTSRPTPRRSPASWRASRGSHPTSGKAGK